MGVQLVSLTEIPLKTVLLTVGSDVIVHEEPPLTGASVMGFIYGYVDTTALTPADLVEMRLEIKLAPTEPFIPTDTQPFRGSIGLWYISIKFFKHGWRLIARQLEGTPKSLKFQGFRGEYA